MTATPFLPDRFPVVRRRRIHCVCIPIDSCQSTAQLNAGQREGIFVKGSGNLIIVSDCSALNYRLPSLVMCPLMSDKGRQIHSQKKLVSDLKYHKKDVSSRFSIL